MVLVALAASTPAVALAADAEVTQACILAYERAGEQRKVYKDIVRARDESAKCIASCPAALAKECEAWLAEDAGKIATLEIETALPREQVVVRVDGVARADPSIELNAGSHELSVAVEGQPQWAESLTLAEGQRVRRTVSTVAPEPSQELKIASIVLGGVAVASLGSAGVLTVLGHLHASDLRETCAPECRNKDVAAIENEWVAAGIFAGLGVAAAAATAVTLGFALGDEAPAVLVVGARDSDVGMSVLFAF